MDEYYKKGMLRWIVHGLRKDKNNRGKRAMDIHAVGSRPRGMRRKTWIDVVEEDVRLRGKMLVVEKLRKMVMGFASLTLSFAEKNGLKTPNYIVVYYNSYCSECVTQLKLYFKLQEAKYELCKYEFQLIAFEFPRL